MMSSKSFLNDINNFSDDERAEFNVIVKNNLNKFFNTLELAIVSQDFPEINQLVHKIKPSIVMLDLKDLSDFIVELEKQQESNQLQIERLLSQLQKEKVGLVKLGWI